MRCFGQFGSRSAMSRGRTLPARTAATRPNAIQKPIAKVSATWTMSGSSAACIDMRVSGSDTGQDLDREYDPHDQQHHAGDHAGEPAVRRGAAQVEAGLD